MIRLAVLLALLAQVAAAETWVAARVVRPASILAPSDVSLIEGSVPGALSGATNIVGLEARVILYPGRPIRDGDVGPPAVVERNAIVILNYRRGGLKISADGRALARGAVGDRIRVMNLDSRSTVTGRIAPDGSVIVQ